MSRVRERGIVRGCCLGVVALILVVGGGAFVADRALAAPALGAEPAGPGHGSSEVAIAVALGSEAAAKLVAGPDAVVTLSEQDLTVLAIAHNPHPDRYRDLTVRVRLGLMVVSATIDIGPLSPTVVAHVSVILDHATTGPQLVAHVDGVDIGMLGVPGFISDRVAAQLDRTLSIDSLFAGAPELRSLRDDIDCVVVVDTGVRIGVHRPGAPPDPSQCG